MDLNNIEEESAEIREFMKIYLKDGSFICAPLGDIGDQNVLAIIEDVGVAVNLTDKWGWWHVSCAYKKGESTVLSVGNSENFFAVNS